MTKKEIKRQILTAKDEINNLEREQEKLYKGLMSKLGILEDSELDEWLWDWVFNDSACSEKCFFNLYDSNKK